MDTAPDTTAEAALLDLEEALRRIPAAAALPGPAFTDLIRNVVSELEIRVGKQLSAALTDAQLEEFDAISHYEAEHPESLQNGAGPAAAWLEANCPGFRHTVTEALRELLTQTRDILETRASTHS